jgi:hypothetical protein
MTADVLRQDTLGTSLPRWSTPMGAGQAGAAPDRAEILELFTEPDFYFRTGRPTLLPEWELAELLGADARPLLADGVLFGLYAVESEGSTHGGHYTLHLRLRAAAPLSWWICAYHEVVSALRWQREVVRLTMRFAEFDVQGLCVARALGLTEEGTLADVLVRDGRRWGRVFFSQTWAPGP